MRERFSPKNKYLEISFYLWGFYSFLKTYTLREDNPLLFRKIEKMIDATLASTREFIRKNMKMVFTPTGNELTEEDTAIMAKAMVSSRKSLQDNEYTSRRYMLAETFPTFSVDIDFKKSLEGMVKNIKNEEVLLPFPITTFQLLYRDVPLGVVVSQDANTHELTILTAIPMTKFKVSQPIRAMGESEMRVIDNRVLRTIDAGTVKPNQLAQSLQFHDVPKKHIMATRIDLESMPVLVGLHPELLEEIKYICMALEANIAQREPVVNAKSSVKIPQMVKDIYRIVTVKTLDIPKRKNSEPTYHHRFHIRRAHWKTIKGERRRIAWYFAGDINLGVVNKDYDATKETLGTR